MEVCAYNCKQEAKYQLKNGKWCCQPNYQQCPAIRRKNSDQVKLTYKNGRISSIEKFNLNHISWNKGLTKETNESLLKASNTYKDGIKTGRIKLSFLGKKHSDETKKKIALNGGYRHGSGRGKRGWYKGYWCDSSWELAWVVYNLEQGIKFQRNTQGFDYEFEGKKYKYFPDFLLENGQYVEIKGWLDKQNQVKLKSFPYNLTIISKNEISMYLKYVENKYGKDFIKLYKG